MSEGFDAYIKFQNLTHRVRIIFLLLSTSIPITIPERSFVAFRHAFQVPPGVGTRNENKHFWEGYFNKRWLFVGNITSYFGEPTVVEHQPTPTGTLWTFTR